MTQPKQVTPVAKLLRERFSGKKFRKNVFAAVGKILKAKGEEAAVEFLAGKVEDNPPDFRPPAKCLIVAKSRPFEEWPIHKASENIQSHVYGLTLEERKTSSPGTSKAAHDEWFASTGVDDRGYRSVQGLNLVFQNAFAVYDGVIEKVRNRNEKRKKRLALKNKDRKEDGFAEFDFQEESAFGEDGKFVHPPGINRSIYCYQQTSPRPYVAGMIEGELPLEFAEYAADPAAPILVGIPDRLLIPEGEPGHVPAWQRIPNDIPAGEKGHVSGLSSNKHKRMRKWYSWSNHKPKPGRRSAPDKATLDHARLADALLVLIPIQSDWVLVDARGLLRNVQWRDLVEEGKELTLDGLLEFFTGDPVIDPVRGVVTFISKNAIVKSEKRTYKGKKSKELLERLTDMGEDGLPGQVGLASVDLGQNNILAVDYVRVGRSDSGLVAQDLAKELLPDELDRDVRRYRHAQDALEEEIRRSAVLALPAEMQAEVLRVEEAAARDARQVILDLGVDVSAVPWVEMSSGTTYISDYLLAAGKDPEIVHFTPNAKEGEESCLVKRSDYGWSRFAHPHLSKETREALNKTLWDLKRSHKGYAKLSRRKMEFGRRCANHVVARLKKLSQCGKVVVAIEDLNVIIHHGFGRRTKGWDNFFRAKQENRWFMQLLHKSLTDLGLHRGIPVIEVNPARTSQTCPACGHCDPGNRKKGTEKFRCLKCGKTFNADLEVATVNIRQVAMTGVAMPKPEREDSGDAQGLGGARGRKKAKSKAKVQAAKNSCA